MFDNIGTTELIVIGVVILVFFGSTKLKEVARGLGESSSEIKKAKKEFEGALTEIKTEPLDTPDLPEKKKESVDSKPKRAGGGKK